MATDKRERQRAARIEKNVAEATAAKRAKTRRTLIRLVVGAAVVLAVLFGVSQLMGDDADSDTATGGDAETDTTPTTEAPPEPEYTDPDLAAEVLAREAPQPEPPPEDTPADALEPTTLIEGRGEAAAEAGDTLTVHYVGVLADGSEFDQSWERGEPFEVTLGQGMVIAGWDEGLLGARIGERRHLVIGADNAYGDQGQGPIPPGAPLAFDVDIVDIRPGG